MAATIWEVNGSTGADTNGAGFIVGGAGTDYSINAGGYNFTDLVLVTASTCSSVSHSFISADVGNVLRITAGTNFTAGFYQILSVALGVATLDRVAGTLGATGGSYIVGGAFLTIAQAFSAASAGDIIYVKSSATYTFTTTITINKSNVSFVGYTTTRTDKGKPTITCATNSVILFTLSSNGAAWSNFNMTHTAGTRGKAVSCASVTRAAAALYNCILDGFNIAVDGTNGGSNGSTLSMPVLFMAACEVKNSVNDGIQINDDSWGVLFACSIHNNGRDGVRGVFSNASGATGGIMLNRCLVWSNTGKGINDTSNGSQLGGASSQGIACHNCVFYANGSDGIGSSAAINLSIINNIFYLNTGYGVSLPAAATTYNPYGNVCNLGNFYYNNNSGGAQRNNVNAGEGDVSGSADPFTAAGTDFTLNATSGGGAACKAAGYPITIP